MEEVKTLIPPRPVFQNQPISCPWVTCQPYALTRPIKSKPISVSNSSSTTKKSPCPAAPNNFESQSSSSHFFYFLRLMQLFPETHPATLHTVLTLSDNNFFFAIDKLLYAKKCKGNIHKKQGHTTRNVRGRGGYSGRGRGGYKRSSPSVYQPPSSTRAISDDLVEVQRLIGMAESPYLEVQSISAEDNTDDFNQQVVNISVNGSDQVISSGNQNFEGDNQEVIEIVCFDQDQQMEHQHKIDDAMSIETFNDSGMQDDSFAYKKDDSEPAVIVVNTINDLDDSGVTEDGESALVNPIELTQLDSADLANNSLLDEEMMENHT